MDNEVKKQSVDASTLDASNNAQVLHKNGLVYKMPQSLSTTVDKTFIKNYAQRQTYESSKKDTIIFDVNSGSKYVDPENCALMFDLVVTGTGIGGDTRFRFDESAHVGAKAIFDSILITAKNGTELDRINALNYYSMVKCKYSKNSECGQDMAELSGVGTEGLEDAVAQRFVVPLKDISGLFNPVVKGMKMPASLISGARIELTLASANRALQRYDPVAVDSGSGTNIQFQVRDAQLIMLCHELNSNTARVLNSESASNGLEYTYTRSFVTNIPTTQTSVNIQVKKAVSQGLRVFTLPVPTATINDVAVDSFKSRSSLLLSNPTGKANFSYRVGSNFYPQQKITSKEENLYVTYDCFGKNQDCESKGTSVTKDEHENEILVLGVSLESDSRLNLSGTPINNSNSLELEAQFTSEAGEGSGTNYITALEYVSVARCFLTNVSVKI